MKEIKFSNSRIAICAFISLLVSACGGGGGGSEITAGGGSGTQSLPAVGQNDPVISGVPATSVTQGVTYGFTPIANDPDGDILVFSIANKPSWASFDTDSGVLTGTPGAGDVGSYQNISISVDDGQASASLSSFSIEVLGTATGAATLSWTPPTQNSDNSQLTDLAGFTVRYGTALGDYPNTDTVSNGVATHMVENLSPETWYFVVQAFDTSGNHSEYSNVVSKRVVAN